jgi:hypothetical protein
MQFGQLLSAELCFRPQHNHHTSRPLSLIHNTAIMSEYVKVEKIVPKFPPPAFSDIAKASNDVCLGTHRAPDNAIADSSACQLINKDFYHTAAGRRHELSSARTHLRFCSRPRG